MELHFSFSPPNPWFLCKARLWGLCDRNSEESKHLFPKSMKQSQAQQAEKVQMYINCRKWHYNTTCNPIFTERGMTAFYFEKCVAIKEMMMLPRVKGIKDFTDVIR